MSDERQWFEDHFDAAIQVFAFLGDAGRPMQGRRVADVGCGDGIIDFCLAVQAQPAELVGFDVNPTNVEHLTEQCRRHGQLKGDLPGNLRFERTTPTSIPAEDASFDQVISWSAFEHIGDPHGVLGEVRRILKPDGVLFIQLWPFFHSEHGSHLWPWFPGEGFLQLRTEQQPLLDRLDAEDLGVPGYGAMMKREYGTLNRLTLDELQRCLLATGFDVRKVELITNTVQLEPHHARYPLTDLLTAGVKLLATPRG